MGAKVDWVASQDPTRSEAHLLLFQPLLQIFKKISMDKVGDGKKAIAT
jgi:hypothetical protein